MRFKICLLLVFLCCPQVSLGDTWLSGDVVLEKAYSALDVVPESLKIRYRPSGINVPNGQRSWSTEVINGGESNTPRVKVRLEVDGDLQQSWVVGFARRRSVVCYVTPKDLPPGRLIDLEQLERVEKYWDGKGYPVTERETVLGRQSRRFLPAGTVLMKRDLILRPVIARGDHVLVSLRQDNVLMSFEGVATRPGYPGRMLPVKTPAGNKVNVWVDYNGKIRTFD